eukprot:TRINITY_DN1411_c0_g1_i1.p1 TRINITY_DN1411_c0_g1~~TRINITY_DN1411_c0_g1_i1.p1  ORF type:complete len:559 (+),score=71.45 TRINITY_DN1411_c0_g1_i1:81-1757(+)
MDTLGTAQQGVIEIPFSELTIVKTLGEGGFGEVSLAEWRGIKVALKKFKASVENVSHEAKTLTLLRYKFIVTLMGITTDPHTHNVILIMEYMKHGSLEDLLFKQQVKLSRGEVIRLALDVAKGVKYLHSQNPKLIHRDLKSANVLLHLDKRRAKIADFGSAKFLRPNVQAVTVIVTLGVAIPPEMLAEEEYNEKVDIFSFGVILYEMLTNKRLPVLEEAQRQKRIRDNIANDTQLMKLMLDCCVTDPDKRPTVEGVVTALKIIKSIAKPKPAINVKNNSVLTLTLTHPKIWDPKATSDELSTIPLPSFIQASENEPKNAILIRNLAFTMYFRGIASCKVYGLDMTQQQLCLKAIDLDPRYSYPYHHLGFSLPAGRSIKLLNGTQITQQQLYLKAVDLDPEYVFALHHLGNTLPVKGSIKLLNGTQITQQQLYLKAIDLNDNYPHAHNALGYVLPAGGSIKLLNGKQMTQQQLFLKAVHLDSKDHTAYTNLGNTLPTKGSIKLLNGTQMTQQQLFLKAIDLDPTYPYAYHALGHALPTGGSIKLSNGVLMTKSQLLNKS